MEFEFDKEIDSLLRRTARRGEAVFDGQTPKSIHADADEISLFAENSLPAKARARMTEHLADCDRCRKILSNLISINSEAVSENVHAREIVAGSVASLPWYQKLFSFPQMAYAMGALALLFSGIIALMVLQNARESQNASVAQMEDVQEKTQGAKGMSSDGDDAPSTEVYPTPNSVSTTTANTSSSNSTTSTVAANANTAYPASKPMVVPGTLGGAANSNASVSLDEKQLSEERAGKPETTTAAAPAPARDKVTELAKKEDFVADGPPAKKSENEYRVDGLTRQQTTNTQNLPLQNQARIAPDTQSARSNSQERMEDKRRVAEKDSDLATAGGETKSKVAAARKAPTTRSAGGKTFNYANGVWYDSAYNQQGTVNVRRGTDAYKKLDSGVRSIAESVGGIVVVVWKDKAYRIQ